MNRDRMFGILFALAPALAGGCAEKEPAPAAAKRGPAEPGAAAEIKAEVWLNTAGGKPVTLKELRGRVVVIGFFTTWAPPCVAAMTDLAEMHKVFKDRGLSVIALSGEPAGELDAVRAYAARLKMSMPIGVGAGGTAVTYQITGYPHVVVIGRTGKFAWAGHPVEPEFPKAIDAQLDAK